MRTEVKILGALWFFQVVNYIDRVAISFAAPSMMSSLSLSHENFGLALSAFSVGYMLCQIPGGLLADRFGARTLMIIAPVFWAFFTGATGLVVGLSGLIAVRALFGVAEGLSNMCGYKVIGDNFTKKAQSTAVAIWATAFAVAPILAGPFVSHMLEQVGWRWLFVMLALPALLVSVSNYFLIPKSAPKSKSAPRPKAELGKIFRSPTFWIIGFAYFCFNIAYWGYIGWMPTYLSSSRGIEIKALGLIGAIPYAFALAGLLTAGWLASGPLLNHRRQMLLVFYLLAASGFYFAYSAQSVAGSIAGLSMTAFFLYGSLGSLGAVILEYAPESVRATYSGSVTTLGQLGGAIAPWLIGYFVTQTGNFSIGFGFMAVGLIVAAICLGILAMFHSAQTGSEELA